jgi:hypothetical protein
MGKEEAMRMLVVSGSYQNYQLIERGAERVGQRLFNYIDDNAEINKLSGRRTTDVSVSPEEKSASEEKSADNGVEIFLIRSNFDQTQSNSDSNSDVLVRVSACRGKCRIIFLINLWRKICINEFRQKFLTNLDKFLFDFRFLFKYTNIN